MKGCTFIFRADFTAEQKNALSGDVEYIVKYRGLFFQRVVPQRFYYNIPHPHKLDRIEVAFIRPKNKSAPD